MGVLAIVQTVCMSLELHVLRVNEIFSKCRQLLSSYFEPQRNDHFNRTLAINDQSLWTDKFDKVANSAANFTYDENLERQTV